jgi:multidrug efflux pump subunit AcrB
MSVTDVVHSINESNLIFPVGDVRVGTRDYNIYANSQVPIVEVPVRSMNRANVLVGDIGQAKDAGQLQTNVVRVDGQESVYIPILKQGSASNTSTIVDGVKAAVQHLLDLPSVLKTDVVFHQSIFVKIAVKNVINKGTVGLCLTALIILLFLGNVRAYCSRSSLDSDLLSRYVSWLEPRWQFDKYDGPRRTGSSVVPPHR